MPRKTNEQIRAELDELNAKMAERQHISDALLITKKSSTYRKNLSASLTGVSKTKEHIEARRKAMPDQGGENNSFYGKYHTDETKRQIGNKNRGKIAYNRGTNHSEDALKKMRQPRSEEGKLNMRKPRTKMLTCPHCNKTGASGNMARYHIDNCKHK